MLSFQRTGKKLETASGKYDDIIMSTSFAIAVSPLTVETNNPFADINF